MTPGTFQEWTPLGNHGCSIDSRMIAVSLYYFKFVILLVALVIIIGSHSSRFANLIGKKSPVVILLSYAKLLKVSFKSLSFGNLNYPGDSVKTVWLPDATVNYLSRKHVILFLTAVFILLVGLVYTLLFSYHDSDFYISLGGESSGGQELQTFIETYHAPYTPKHCYWTGLDCC